MTTFPGANATAQWFQDNYPGANMNPNVGLIHTTEGTGWPGYNGGATAPNITARPDFKNKRLNFRQHFPDEKSSRALVNKAGGVETNTLNCTQIELVGTCDPATRDRWKKQGVNFIYWPDPPDWAIRDLAKWMVHMHKKHGVKLQAPAFESYPASYGSGGQRFSFSDWRNFYGFCGHQHVPENLHGDPGKLPIQEAIREAKRQMGVKDKPVNVTWKKAVQKDPKKGYLTLQTATLNVNEVPKVKSLKAAMETIEKGMTGAQLGGLQEMGNPTYVKAARQTLENHEYHGLDGDPQHNVGLVFDKKMWKFEEAEYFHLFNGKSGISHTRHGLWERIHLIADPSIKLYLVSTHYPPGAFDPSGNIRKKGDRIATRVEMWRDACRADRKMIAELARDGHPIISFTDLNRQKVGPYGSEIAGRKVQRASAALDHVNFIDGLKHKFREVETVKKEVPGTDHKALTNRVKLVLG